MYICQKANKDDMICRWMTELHPEFRPRILPSGKKLRTAFGQSETSLRTQGGTRAVNVCEMSVGVTPRQLRKDSEI